MGEPATPRQREVLRAIRDMTKARGFAPSIRELAAELDVRSTNTVADHLRALLAKEFVKRCPKSARTLALTESGLKQLG